MDGATREKLASFLRDVRELPNEAAKTNRFSSLVGELYPGTAAVRRLSGGIEKAVRIDFGDKKKRGRIDAYYGNAVIEFENSMRATEKDALRQLREYSAATWAEEGTPYRPLLCVATDGLVWKTFRPRLPEGFRGKPKPNDVSLEPLSSFELSERSLGSFWIWLTSFLFRDPKTLPTPERFRVEFGSRSLAFDDAMDALARAWEIAKDEPESRVAFDTWAKYLTVTYGVFDAGKTGKPSREQVHLFLKHTYLASIAKLLIWAALSRGKTTDALADVAKDVLSGEYFRAQGIENLVEDDFFQWIRRAKAWARHAPVWERILVQMQGYDLARLSQDVLKGVYQELVDPKDRHELGEYYTPEWLCERIVEELLPPRGFASVLDPTCGSGSFLRAAIAHELKANPSGSDAMRLRQILSNVVGIDIHPLAVTIARATYVLAVRSLLKATKRPVQTPVYLADSLFLPAGVKQLELGEKPGFRIRFGKDRRVSMSAQLVSNPEFFDPAIDVCSKVAIDHARKRKKTTDRLNATLRGWSPTSLHTRTPMTWWMRCGSSPRNSPT